jgi:putative Mg2+ transporter-C (MgtC) family protein
LDEVMTVAFGEPIGQGWAQIADLAIAFVLSLLIGTEREVQHKAAGMRTYTLVGLGSALFVLVSKYGFTDVLGDHVTLDPSRVAAQIVTGVGFIGGGLIFVRRDAVRGLTTAASVWVTAAVGAAAGGGLPVLAVVTTAFYFVVLYGVRPLTRLVVRLQTGAVGLRISYLDNRGVLREIVNLATRGGFAISELTTVHVAGGDADHDLDRDDRRDRDQPVAEPRPTTVEVTMVLTGRGDVNRLTAELSELAGVLGVRTGAAVTEE